MGKTAARNGKISSFSLEGLGEGEKSLQYPFGGEKNGSTL